MSALQPTQSSKLFAYMGIDCDLRAPSKMPDEEFPKLPPDAEMVELERQKEDMKRRLLATRKPERLTIATQRRQGLAFGG